MQNWKKTQWERVSYSCKGKTTSAGHCKKLKLKGTLRTLLLSDFFSNTSSVAGQFCSQYSMEKYSCDVQQAHNRPNEYAVFTLK